MQCLLGFEEPAETKGEKMRVLLRRCSLALDDWLHQYASEQCDPAKVMESSTRVYNSGGTLAYLADLQRDIRAALKPARNTPKRKGKR